MSSSTKPLLGRFILAEIDEVDAVEAARVSILETLSDDWTYLADVAAIVTEVAKKHGLSLGVTDRDEWLRIQAGLATDPNFERRLRLTVRVLESMLGDGLIVPGEVREAFVPWDGSPSDWLARIERGWRSFGARLSVSDVCWFEITEKGELLGETIGTTPE